MSLSLSILGGFIFAFLPWALGHQILKQDSKANLSLKIATGWFILYLLTGLLALFSAINQSTLIILSIGLSLYLSKTIYWGISTLGEQLITTYRSSNLLEKSLISLGFFLLLIRAFQALAPSTNWDSLNQHLPLLYSRLQQTDLSAIFELATDRRTPFSGVLIKLPVYCFGLDGRAISLTFFGVYCSIILQTWNLCCKIGSKQIAILACACLLSWSDVAIYFKHLGDETFFCLIVMAVFSSILIKPNLKRSHCFTASILGLACSMKLTAIFFIPILAFIYLIKHYRELGPKIAILCICITLVFTAIPYLKQFHDYNMIYPFQRWTNLLDKGPSPPEGYRFSEIKQKRLSYGIDDHRDNQRVESQPLNKWWTNFKRLIYLPLGPYLYWIILLGCFARFKSVSFTEQKHIHWNSFKTGAGVILVSLSLAMVAWSFSPQATTRYLLPLWCIWAICCGFALYELTTALKLRAFIKVCLALCLIFSFLLESKAVFKTFKKSPWQNAREYWLKYSSDGPLIAEYQTLINKENSKTFYIGNASYLMIKDQHQCAQVGNEVGWRDPIAFQKFLKTENFKYLVYSHSAKSFDEIYCFLKDHAKENRVLSLIKTHPLGEIYRVVY